MHPPQPLLKVPGTAEISPMMKDLIGEYDKTINKIIDTVTPESATFDNVVQPWADTDNAMQPALCMIANLQYCSPLLETQDAVRDALKLWRAADAKWSQRSDYFSLLQSALQKEIENPKLDQESRFVLEQHIHEYERCGYGKLSEKEIVEYLQGRLEIGELCSQFRRNIAQESGGIWFTKNELDGVPEDELAKWKTDVSSPAQIRKYVPFANGGTRVVLKHAHDAEVRRRIYVEDDRKLSQNDTLLEDIVRRRFAQAQKLGLPHHAAFRAQTRAVKSAEWIKNFLESINDPIVALAKKDITQLQTFRIEDRKRRHIYKDGDEETFPNWEQLYYENLMKRSLDVNEEEISEYFPLEHVIGAMLGLFSSFLGLRFDRIADSELDESVRWHESVEIYAVWNGPTDEEEFIGYLYLDLVWREHKYRGNQNVNVECGYLKPDGSRKYPSTVLSCGLPTPPPGTCKLLKHEEVVTMFHELGHGIHDLISRTRFVKFHGSNRLPVDVGETPSMFLENYVWVGDILSELSRHYTTLDPNYLAKWRKDNIGRDDPPTTIPKHLVQALQKSKYIHKGIFLSRQLSISLFDMRIHSINSQNDIDKLDIRKLWYTLREEIEGQDFSDVKLSGSDFTTFGHLISGYDVGYYGYLACSAFAQDIWLSEFAQNPRDRKTWDRYRRSILEYGGAHPNKMQMLEDFLGRKPNFNALVNSVEQHVV